ncbi:MAG: 3D domain-containing protein [Planctomycetota bacterium]
MATPGRGPSARRAASRRRAAEVVIFVAGACAVSWSAFTAKRDAPPPTLAAIEPVGAELGAASVQAIRRAAPSDPLATTKIDAAPSAEAPITDPGVRYFNGRPVRPVQQQFMTVTAYSPDHRSCGKWADGITASGRSVWTNAGELVAADPRVLPMGSLVSVPGYAGERIVPVLDVGGAIKGARLDVLYPTHGRALRWGVQDLRVTVWEYAD